VNRTLYIDVDEISFILFSESFFKNFLHFLLTLTIYHAFYFRKVHGWTPSRLKVDLSKASSGRLSVEAE